MLDILPCAPKCWHFTTIITNVNSGYGLHHVDLLLCVWVMKYMWLYAIHMALGCSSAKGRAAVEQEISGWVGGLPFGRGIRANVSIVSWIFFIGWGLTSSVPSCFFKRPAAVSYIVFTGNVARSAPCVLAGAVCYSSVVVDHLPHPLSTRL